MRDGARWRARGARTYQAGPSPLSSVGQGPPLPHVKETPKKTDVITHDRTALSKSTVVQVHVPAKVAVDLDLTAIHELELDLFGKLGHPACYSGFDIRWIVEEEFFVNESRSIQHR